MNPHDYLGDDGPALLLLCTAFALPAEMERAGVAPLKLSEWNALSKRLAPSSLQRPGALLGKTGMQVLGLRKLAVRQVASCMVAKNSWPGGHMSSAAKSGQG